nr:reverse transcriptase domain-containing protein [Tanacetum cinerariifolium]
TNIELKHGLLTLVQNKQFFGHDKEDPHAQVRYFNRIISTLNEAWDRFKDLLRACPHHGFSELHQLDTFYNALNSKDQDSLNSAAGGNFLEKMPCECLAIIESKSKVHYSRNKPVVAKVSTNTSTSVKESCVTCGGAHSYRNCPATDGNVYRDNIQEFVSQASANVQRNNQNRFIPNQNRGNNFNQGPVYQPLVFQPSAYQAPAYQAPAPQTQGVSKEDFSAYVQANDAIMRNMQTQYVSFEISFVDALILMPKFASTLKALIGNKEKLSEMARTPLNEHCSAVLLNTSTSRCKHQFNAIFVWKRLSLPGLTPTYMTLELADHLICRPVGVAEDVYVKVGSFHFPADFVVVDFDADPRVPFGRSFLKTGRALIDVFEVELKDLPPHLEYAFLEGDNKLPAIIAKVLSVEEKTALITVLKSHKRAITWKLYDIKGIDPEFCTHKILMEEDFELAVQHQRRVNPKIHDVI